MSEAQLPALSSEDEEALENGKVWRPSNLKPHHQAICELALVGTELTEIARRFNMHKVSISWVLRKPECREYMQTRINDLTMELRERLFQPAVSAIADGLSSEDIDVRLKAADMFLRSQGLYAKKTDETNKMTAEDLVAQLLKSKNVQVNINQGTIINQPATPAAEPRSPLIEGERDE